MSGAASNARSCEINSICVLLNQRHNVIISGFAFGFFCLFLLCFGGCDELCLCGNDILLPLSRTSFACI